MFRNKKGFTLIELMIVVAIIGILAAIAIPMYNANVNKAKLQEATDTLGALKDEVCNIAADTGAPPLASGDGGILANLGVQVPLSLGQGGTGGRKWTYRTVDNTAAGSVDGTYIVRATGGASPDIGSVLALKQVNCTGNWVAADGVFTAWVWSSPNAKVNNWLPK